MFVDTIPSNVYCNKSKMRLSLGQNLLVRLKQMTSPNNAPSSTGAEEDQCKSLRSVTVPARWTMDQKLPLVGFGPCHRAAPLSSVEVAGRFVLLMPRLRRRTRLGDMAPFKGPRKNPQSNESW